MIDRIIIFLASLMISLTMALLSIDYKDEYNVLMGIIATSGAIVAIYEFFKNSK